MGEIRAEIEDMVHRETRAWNAQDVEALVELFHPDMIWPWPPSSVDHDPATWIFALGRYNRERWKTCWEELFQTAHCTFAHIDVEIADMEQGEAIEGGR